MNHKSKASLSEWLWLGGAIKTHQDEVACKSAERAELEELSMTAAEAGTRTLHPLAPFRTGKRELVAASLHAKSVCATLRALEVGLDHLDRDGPVRDLLVRGLPPEVSPSQLKALVELHGTADVPPASMRTEESAALETAARALLDLARAPERALQGAFARRFFRVGASTLLVALVVLATGFALRGAVLPPNLAEGRPWRASSAYPRFSPETGIVEGRATRIFFHTERENQPWVEIDLGSPMSVARVDITNRRDFGRDRAVPLIIEGSLDGEAWTELGNIATPFVARTIEFDPRELRYVRARSTKRTMLHLEAFEVR
jgi:hypothetical protein